MKKYSWVKKRAQFKRQIVNFNDTVLFLVHNEESY
jgi:hypothetical protein